MARGKYNKDYRLTEEFQANGRVRTGYEYIGNPWFFCADGETVAVNRKKALALVILCAGAFVVALVPFSLMMHTLWIALPFAFIALPIVMLGDLVIALQGFREPMEHRNADKLNNSYPARSLFMTYLSAIALAGEVIWLCLNGGFQTAGDAVMAGCTAALFCLALLLFRLRNFFRAEERRKEEKPEKQTGKKKK